MPAAARSLPPHTRLSTEMPDVNLAIIGAGKTVSDCVNVVDAFNSSHPESPANLKCVFIDQRNYVPSADIHVPVVKTDDANGGDVIQRIADDGIDYLISVNNHQILKAELINSVRKQVLNFHNGPLPRYGGVNACAWAIFNGERQHGVTWHVMESAIDAGPIIDQEMFPIAPNETAISLIMKCIIHGMNAFRRILPTLVSGTPQATPQDAANRLYYSRKDIPANAVFDFTWPYVQADRYMRCLNTSPFPPMLPFGRARLGRRTVRISRIAKAADAPSAAAGTIVRADEDGIVVSIADCDISIRGILGEDGKRLPLASAITGLNHLAGFNMQFQDNGRAEHEG